MKYWSFSDEKKVEMMDALTAELPVLRAKAGASQAEVSQAVGISRQTYNAVEGGGKRMAWGLYLALLLYFDYHPLTHAFMRSIRVFPAELDALRDASLPVSGSRAAEKQRRAF